VRKDSVDDLITQLNEELRLKMTSSWGSFMMHHEK